MKRAMAIAAVVAIFSPAALLIASACAALPCCAAETDRVTAVLPCCQPTICATSSPDVQAKAEKSSTSITLQHQAAAIVDDAPRQHLREIAPAPHSPPPTRLRLALIATLLI